MSATPISLEEFQALRDLIRTKFGINYDDTKQFFTAKPPPDTSGKGRRRILFGVSPVSSASPEREAEFAELASVPSNNETYFFRERAQLDVLAKEAVDDYYRDGGGILKSGLRRVRPGRSRLALQ